MLDRRQLITGIVSAVIAGLVMPRRSAAQVTTTALTDRLSLITSGGTNVLVLSTPDGLVLVDSGAPDRSDALVAELKSLSSGGVRTVFNTHYHPENTGANEMLRQSGATIVAHENTRLWMATPVWNPAQDRYRPPRPTPAQPTQTFRTEASMTAGGERLEYGYLIEAHTSGDIYIRFRDANVLAVGDVASPTRDPELDYFTGAWIGGRVDAMDRLLDLCDDRTRVVPGFGPVMTKAELKAERDVMKTVYDRTVDQVREGDDATDMLKAGVLNGLARTWKDPQRFLYDVQKGLWAHHNKLSPNVV
ncbi:MAG TPA: MBL fold metallo-hydrolase [Vicinamibacterales bacterium]|nr:MBL fold metallo-hydrolase [Vicinamibacterales bacterium]